MSWWRTVGVATTFAFSVTPTFAQSWKPAHNVEFVSASAAGSASDTGLRLVERMLHERKLLEVSSTVLNKPGGGGNIGWTYVNQQSPDGHS
jgi:putative tricarboxylic transport membrane protein